MPVVHAAGVGTVAEDEDEASASLSFDCASVSIFNAISLCSAGEVTLINIYIFDEKKI